MNINGNTRTSIYLFKLKYLFIVFRRNIFILFMRISFLFVECTNCKSLVKLIKTQTKANLTRELWCSQWVYLDESNFEINGRQFNWTPSCYYNFFLFTSTRPPCFFFAAIFYFNSYICYVCEITAAGHNFVRNATDLIWFQRGIFF